MINHRERGRTVSMAVHGEGLCNESKNTKEISLWKSLRGIRDVENLTEFGGKTGKIYEVRIVRSEISLIPRTVKDLYVTRKGGTTQNDYRKGGEKK